MSVRLIIEFLFQSIAGEKGHLLPTPLRECKGSGFSVLYNTLPLRSQSPHQNRVIFGGMAVQDYFSMAEDPPYVERHCKHKLSDILIIALASYLCGGDVLSHARIGQDLYSGYTLPYYTACSGYPL